ncbi:hypothetical protein [Oxynema aestuarii]|nr:hypothetical protein [Oxynema aestuarii]
MGDLFPVWIFANSCAIAPRIDMMVKVARPELGRSPQIRQFQPD